MFYNISGLTVGLLGLILFTLCSFANTQKQAFRITLLCVVCLIIGACYGILVDQFTESSTTLTTQQLKEQNGLMLLFFFLISVQVLLSTLILYTSPHTTNLFIRIALWPMMGLLTVYALICCFEIHADSYLLSKLMCRPPHEVKLILYHVVIISMAISLIYGTYLYNRDKKELNSVLLTSFSRKDTLEYGVWLSNLLWSGETIVYCVLLSYFHTQPTIEIAVSTIIAASTFVLYAKTSYHYTRRYKELKTSALPHSVDRFTKKTSMQGTTHDLDHDKYQAIIDNDNSTTEADKILANNKYSRLIESFNRQIEKEKIYLRSTLRSDEVASLIHTNRTYVTNIIKEEYQCTFSDYINGKRIQYAKELMHINTKMGLEEIAEKSGFTSASSFCRTFKRVTGMPPKKWLEIEVHTFEKNI